MFHLCSMMSTDEIMLLLSTLVSVLYIPTVHGFRAFLHYVVGCCTGISLAMYEGKVLLLEVCHLMQQS